MCVCIGEREKWMTKITWRFGFWVLEAGKGGWGFFFFLINFCFRIRWQVGNVGTKETKNCKSLDKQDEKEREREREREPPQHINIPPAYPVNSSVCHIP